MNVLNIAVSPAQLAVWRRRLAPRRQPLFLDRQTATELHLETLPRAEAGLSATEGDTFTTWNIPATVDRVAWLTLVQWDALPAATRTRLLRLQVRSGRGNVPLGRHFTDLFRADLLPGWPAGRFLWRPEQLTPAVLARIVSAGQVACQRGSVPAEVWDAAQTALPRARALAGTFAGGAGNCFGTVMGAAGLVGAEDEWTQREPFEAFLAARAVRGGQDARPGTLLVWRSADGLVQHAAVTLGAGRDGQSWALHKPSQSWMTARVVLPTRSLIAASRTPGHRLTRLQLV